jgi:hypothetical protein
MGALDQLQAFDSDREEQIAALRRDADFLEKLGITTTDAYQVKVSDDNRAQVGSAMERLVRADWFERKDPRSPAVRLREMADNLAAGAPDPEPAHSRDPGLRDRWMELYGLVARLGTMVQKQLRGLDWTEDEESLFQGFKYILAETHGYYGNSWEESRDDAPRWVEIADDPNSGHMLAAAVGRPRALHVLYPWHGKEVLCVGAVMPFFELQDMTRLTDTEWKARLDSEAPPKPPAWLQAVAPP